MSLKCSRCFLVNFAKFVRTPFLPSSTGRLLLIKAVSIVVNRELANETVNYDTKTKAHVPNWFRNVKLSKKGSPGEIWTGFRKMPVLETLFNSCNPRKRFLCFPVKSRCFWRLTRIFKEVRNKLRWDCQR